jgi:hypothetical protein
LIVYIKKRNHLFLCEVGRVDAVSTKTTLEPREKADMDRAHENHDGGKVRNDKKSIAIE